ncbi:uncharacterized protein [Halyomorpha halys]|uniref:uncharacterized protein n=1 Tax=Halyomorpha halys TaxID=286706 RepID=UPI0006D4E152|nr:uncharacterized protein LOC106684009 [Halyomorpha halys]
MVTATDSVLRRLDIVQNKALRIITGAAKSTPILAMQLQAEIESLKDRRKMNVVILYKRVLRNGSDYCASTLGNTRRLKTQLTFIEATKSIITSLGLNFEIREPLPDLTKQSVWTCPYAIVLDLIMPFNQSMTPAEEPRTVALATIAEGYPEPEWIHIYTDGSTTQANKNASAGVACIVACSNCQHLQEQTLPILMESCNYFSFIKDYSRLRKEDSSAVGF